ncbi:LLM class flavin-dependent oxidoreductase [Demequina capsici]|uniref:LLM class flavin-dependent oxidoreductase n=1 Tax=Demequina capsici TaxID=3075620 RepID=A0AA96JFX3_9MICO|nr:LLM class flavin-dependent oxidoreductase [Demequina sp. PMTSA13]WNM27329.1 LLM class flavin-dependent oxidoreductase [Demequina sp. PMTSA13]
MDIGVGLYCLQATASTPRHPATAYRELLDEARLLESLGFESMWLSEHHFFYDGYCPALLPAAQAALSVTQTLRVGTGMLLLPLQEPQRLARMAADIAAGSDGRLDLGVGLGYRDVEFDGKGVARKQRLGRQRAGLEALEQTAVPAGTTLWVGSATPKAVARAGAAGRPIMLSGANPLSLVTELAQAHREGWEQAGRPGGVKPKVVALRNFWLTDDEAERQAVLDWQRASYVLYAGLGWSVAAQSSTEAMDFTTDLDAALKQAVDTSVVGSAQTLIDALTEVSEAGVDGVVLRCIIEGAPKERVDHMLTRFAHEVLPAVRDLEVAV